jgi:hypothetical protein
MASKDALDRIAKKYGETNSLEGTYNDFLAIKKDLERLELLEKAIDILKPYCYIEWDEVNDAFYFSMDASERIPLSEDYDINRCTIGVGDDEIDILKEVF